MAAAILYPSWAKLLNLWQFFPLLFQKGIQKSIWFGHWTLGSWGKKTVKRRDSNTHTKKIQLIKAKFAPKQPFFVWKSYSQISKSFQIWDHLFQLLFHKDSESLNLFENWLKGSGGKKTFKRYIKSEQTKGRTFWLFIGK